ncbi:DUF1203 domain-containing protein [Vibrio brasiliensis]|uniref:DUF1203 domain-containing protein n=1 Tax=Vibrio brasiliensis TaxID=170652 RepID=UPI001EFED1D1|nr:DUF1203 domain-containing protein [Vibrio brasiliensis]MCG9648152.1 DUF1203 domain-containing protein [Vibrio brasiliensis]
MMTDFLVKPLEQTNFEQLFNKDEQQLAQINARWLVADAKPGYPCRVSLQEAEVGERVLLIPFNYHDVNSPYQASGPIFVRENAQVAEMKVNQIPEILAERLLSVRAYSQDSMMLNATTVQGKALTNTIRDLFENSEVSYLQIHNANPGCFNCTVYRA